ncbi:NACHT domain-containing protein, partial [Candidatus Parcubacteria bacterium]
LRPNAGWIVAAVLFVLLILRDVLKEGLTRFFQSLGEWGYRRVAGYRPFWALALRRYRQSLIREYHTLKVPFRPNRPLEMEEIYVPLKVARGKNTDAVDAQAAIADHRRLVVTGAPGAGKTVLLKHLVLRYAQRGLDFPGDPIPIFLELHRLNESDDLRTQLAEALDRHTFPNAARFLDAHLERGDLLFFFDGLDEVNREAREKVVQQISDLLTEYHKCRAVVTCRTAVYGGELDAWADARLEIVEFNDHQIRRFLASWEQDMPAEKSVAHLLRTLRERPRIMQLSRNPLLLTIIAYLYADTPFVLPHSRAEFYKKATDVLLEQWKGTRNRYKASHKRMVLRQLALFNQDRSLKEEERDRRSMGLIPVLEQIREVLPALELKQEDAEPLLDEIIERSGLMLRLDGGEHYQFTHLTLQEYFAAEALAEDWQELMRRF